MAADLLSAKEQAEHIMLDDLADDVGRVRRRDVHVD